jgi:hypothetical protein
MNTVLHLHGWYLHQSILDKDIQMFSDGASHGEYKTIIPKTTSSTFSDFTFVWSIFIFQFLISKFQ